MCGKGFKLDLRLFRELVLGLLTWLLSSAWAEKAVTILGLVDLVGGSTGFRLVLTEGLWDRCELKDSLPM